MRSLIIILFTFIFSQNGWGQMYNILVDRIEIEPTFDLYGNFDGNTETLFTDTISINKSEVEYILSKISSSPVPLQSFKIDGFIWLNGKLTNTLWICDWDRENHPLLEINQCSIETGKYSAYKVRVSYLKRLVN